MDPSDDQPDDSSIKPVSSLRSQFENLTAPKSPSLTLPSASASTRPKSFVLAPSSQFDSRPSSASGHAPLSLEVPGSNPVRSSFESSGSDGDGSETPRARRKAPTPPKSRRPVSAIQLSPIRLTPQVNVTSPTSPPKSIAIPKIAPSRPGRPLTPAGLKSDAPNGPPNGHFRIPSRTHGSPIPHNRSSSLQALDVATSYPPRASSLRHEQGSTAAKVPPPVNRSAKPFRGKEIAETPAETPLTPPMKSQDRKVSPFSTPPSSNESSPSQSPPPLPMHSKPRPPPAAQIPLAQSLPTSRARPGPYDTQEEAPPGLPPRRNVIPSRSQDALVGTSSKPSALMLGFSNKPQAVAQTQVSEPSSGVSSRNQTPPPRPSSDNRRAPLPKRNANAIPGLDYDERTPAADVPASNLSDYPDSSEANRRPPCYSDAPRMIATSYDPRLFDVCGEYVCTTGTATRVWNLLTGKLLLSISHGETIRITALCFKPARRIDEDGSRVWLGTNTGDILELDIPSRRVVGSNDVDHRRHEIVKMHRCATEVWTLDSEGKLFVWPADDSGSPNLNYSVSNGRVTRRPTASLVVGKELWVAQGKDVKIFKPSSQSDFTQLVNPQSSSPQGAGEITCGTTLSTQRDVVYFGHSDGKISIYSRDTYECLEVVSVSIYKVTSLLGVGKYLWAGHSTGLMFVYDISSRPWKITKDWRAHGGPVVSISADQSNSWKLNRLMVVSLGIDNILCTWDGLLEDDWLGDDMQDHDVEYCRFSDVTALVLTWNTGASKPTDLRYDEEDSNFFRDLLQTGDPPDIIVFGLQELVDLEDKTLTAKSFFKSKQKDPYGQEHLSSAYRAWRDYFSHCLDEVMPLDEPYSLLHTASLVGLFTCIFVKSSKSSKFRDVQAVEIKTGMGGLHGNKGAIAVRCIMEDSSLCFVNCHLAAGQSKTADRNNDVAAILESSIMPPTGFSAGDPGIFVSGGDGSMILDNEICILNGDLNYRIDTMTRDSIISSIKSNNLAKLLDRDQLLLSRRKNPGFRLRSFRELPITFSPTYKYDVGTDTYDTSDKRRSPAWCDRILCRGRLQQLDYQRHEVRVSDHRPVSANFKLKVKRVDAAKRDECRRRCMQRYNKFKDGISTESKLDYLQTVFGLSAQEAQKELAATRAA